MSDRATLLIGAVTTVLFVSIGATLFAEGRTLIGSIVLGLGVLRGTMWVRQALAARAETP